MRRAAALVGMAALAGCGGSEEPARYSAPLGADGKPAPLGCEHAVPTQAVAPPDELILPAGSRVLVSEVDEAGSRTVVKGYIEKVPFEMIRAFANTPGVKILSSENEDIEADALVTDGRHRNFWKAIRTCLSGSRFAAAIANRRRR